MVVNTDTATVIIVTVTTMVAFFIEYYINATEHEKVKPGPPKNLQVADISETSIRLRWAVSEDDGGSPDGGYRVEMSESSMGRYRWLATVNGTAFLVEHLTDGTKYTFRVSAQSQGSSSDDVTVQTETTSSLDREHTALSTEEMKRFQDIGLTDLADLNERMRKEKDEILDKWIITKHERPTGEEKQSLNLVLLGKTGAGKSATGNLIVGANRFMESHTSKTCTKSIQKEACEIDGVNVNIIDMPGFGEINTGHEEISREISKVWREFNDRIDGLLFVFNIGNTRFNTDQEAAFTAIQKSSSGRGIIDSCFAILTHIESKEDIESLSEYIEDEVKKESSLGKLLDQTLQQRVIAVNNADKTIYGREVQRQNIIRLILARKGKHLTSEQLEQYLRVACRLSEQNESRARLEQDPDLREETAAFTIIIIFHVVLLQLVSL